MPEGFVYLSDIDPTIKQEMRYAGSRNFLGRPADGYQAGECILTRDAAHALEAAQKSLKQRNLSLKVYDCYRPARAVADFLKWSKEAKGEKAAAQFHPTLAKRDLLRLGYIAKKSGHSRGSSVDLTIVGAIPERPVADGQPCHRPNTGDAALDFGTDFDCFHPLSHTDNPAIKGDARKNRALLAETMTASGFDNYRREWWHFTLRREPFPKTYFDFPIVPRKAD